MLSKIYTGPGQLYLDKDGSWEWIADIEEVLFHGYHYQESTEEETETD